MSLTVSVTEQDAAAVEDLLDGAGIGFTSSTSCGRSYLTVEEDDEGRFLIRILRRRGLWHRIAKVDGKELPSSTDGSRGDPFGP